MSLGDCGRPDGLMGLGICLCKHKRRNTVQEDDDAFPDVCAMIF